jgi:hypothetical protein
MWTLLVPDAIQSVVAVENWVWLHEMEPSIFVPPGVGPGGRDVVPPD